MEDEIKQVIKMVEQGKITAEEAEDLIHTILENPESTLNVTQTDKARFFKISMNDEDGHQMDIAIPMGLVRFVKKFIPSKNIKQLSNQGLDIDEIISSVENAGKSELVNMAGSDGEYIKIWIE